MRSQGILCWQEPPKAWPSSPASLWLVPVSGGRQAEHQEHPPLFIASPGDFTFTTCPAGRHGKGATRCSVGWGRAFLEHLRRLARCPPRLGMRAVLLKPVMPLPVKDKHVLAARAGWSPAPAQRGLCTSGMHEEMGQSCSSRKLEARRQNGSPGGSEKGTFLSLLFTEPEESCAS